MYVCTFAPTCTCIYSSAHTLFPCTLGCSMKGNCPVEYCIYVTIHHPIHRFGSGYTLQAKVNPAMAGDPTSPPPYSSLTTAPPGQPTGPHMQSGVVGGAQEGIIDATPLKLFIEQSFQGAVLLEEHQVHPCGLICKYTTLLCTCCGTEWNLFNLKTPQ